MPHAATMLILLAAFVAPAAADEKAAESVLVGKGFKKVGSTFVLSEESDVGKRLSALLKLQKDYLQASALARGLEWEAREARGMIVDLSRQRLEVGQRLQQTGSEDERNQIVTFYNGLTDRLNILQESANGREKIDEARRRAGTAREGFVQAIHDLRPEIDELNSRYGSLTVDADVVAALDAINRTAKAKVAVGPSKGLQSQVKSYEKIEATLRTEAIPLDPDGGVNRVDVTLNGKVTRSMILDTGASSISLPAEVAAQAGIVPRPDAPKVTVSIANGAQFQARQVILDSVRVGKFTVEKVEAIVMPPEFQGAPMLLGGSFLRNFTSEIRPDARILNLSRIDEPATAEPAGRTTKGQGTPRKR